MLRLPRLLSDGMVLQQKKRVHIWGWDTPGCEVMISFLGKEYLTCADEEGKFSVFLDALAAGGPYTMEIKDRQGQELVLSDIWVCDVWICSGQSNMELPMERVRDKYPGKIADCKNPAIRTFKIAEHADFRGPLTDHLSGEWKPAEENTILSFSGIKRQLQNLVNKFRFILCRHIGCCYLKGGVSWLDYQILLKKL